MKYAMIILTMLTMLTAVAGQAACAGDIDLPAPKKSGGPAVLEAIDRRGSAGQADFPAGYLDMNDFATILWAATGQNRDGTKWTVPMAMGMPPYCKIYVTLDDGSYLYDWKANRLVQVSATNAKGILPMQDFAKKSPAALYFVGDGEAIAKARSKEMAIEWSAVLAGAMSQNVYLAGQAIGVKGRVVYSVDRKGMVEQFKLAAGDVPFFAMFLGKE